MPTRRPRGPAVRHATARDLAGGRDAPIEYEYPEHFNAQLSHRRWLCRPTAQHRTHHLHLVEDRSELDRHLRFRDRLRESVSLAGEYARLKCELAATFPTDREAYSDAKSAFVRRVETET